MPKGDFAEDIKTIRTPVVGSFQQRENSFSKDQLFINGFVDVFKSPATGETQTHFVKRPGTNLQYNVLSETAETGVGRGIYYWDATGGIYIVIGDSLLFYNGSWALLQGLTTTVGRCAIEEISPSAGTRYLCFNDGAKLYIINTSNVVTTITVNFPTPNNADLVYMDGHLFTSKADGTFYHCNIEDPTTWDPTKYLTAEMYSDGLTGLTHQNNLLVAFGPWSTEFFYNAGNAAGSIVSKVEQYVQMVGCLTPLSIVSQDNAVTFIGSSRTAGYGVYTITGTSEFKKISTPVIDRFIQGEHTTIRAIYAFGAKAAGHHFYIMTLPGINVSFAYDHNTDLWFSWCFGSSSSGPFPFVFSTEQTAPWFGYWAIQHVNGNVYFLDPGYYDDDGTNFQCTFRTARIDGGTMKRKFLHRFELIGDKATTTQNVDIIYSDDDYQNWSTARTIDMSANRGMSRRWGNFRRRGFQATYTGNQPWRIEAIEMDVSLGTE